MHFGTEQNVGPKPPDGPFRNGSFVGGSSVNMVVLPHIGFRRTRTQRSGTQRKGTRTRWLFELRQF